MKTRKRERQARRLEADLRGIAENVDHLYCRRPKHRVAIIKSLGAVCALAKLRETSAWVAG